MVAFPAQYGGSGITPFIVNHDGVVYQKDLGNGTSGLVSRIAVFNPDKTWSQVEHAEAK